MKKIASVLLCMVLLFAMFPVNAAAAQNNCMEASVTMSDDGTVTVAVKALQAAANARLNVTFDSAYLRYVGHETAFAAHSVREEAGKLTIGLANSGTNALKAGDELVKLTFAVTGAWDKTELTVTAETFGGKKVDETAAFTLEGPGIRFQDVAVGSWFYEAVDHMAAMGYIKGISASHYGPALEMNRASFVTLLGRLAGVEETKAQTAFADVPVDSFYSGYVAWAVEQGITNGIDATHFAPGASINRAQMVAFLYRYAKSVNPDLVVGNAQEILSSFADAQEVLAYDWMAEPFAWAVENGVINGMDGRLAPNGTSNRAQVAVMLYRFFFEG